MTDKHRLGAFVAKRPAIAGDLDVARTSIEQAKTSPVYGGVVANIDIAIGRLELAKRKTLRVMKELQS